MALGLDGQVPDELVAVLDAVFHEEAVADGVVGDVVLDAQVVRAVHGHAAVEGVVDGRVADVLARHVAGQMPVEGIAGELQMLPHAIELDAFDEHLAGDHRHDVAAEVGLRRIGSEAWILMLRVSRPTSPRSSTSKVTLPKCM
jgi:hypothetical protein